MRQIPAARPAPLGVYNTAGGNVGIARAIAEAGLTGAVAFIGHELNENSARLLEEGAAWTASAEPRRGGGAAPGGSQSSAAASASAAAEESARRPGR